MVGSAIRYGIGAILIGVAAVSSAADKSCDELFDTVSRISELGERIQAWEDAKDQCGGSGLYESRLGSLYTRAGRLEEAEKILTQGLKLHSEYDREIRLGLADVDFYRGDFEAAISKGKALAKDYPDWAGGYAMAGKSLISEQRFKEGAEYTERANYLHEDVDFYAALIVAYYQLDEHEKVVMAMKRAMELEPRTLARPDLVPEVALSLVHLGMLEEAKELLTRHQQLRPESKHDPRFARAVYFLKEQWGKTKPHD